MKTELISYLFLSYLTLLVSGQLQFTTCPSSVCLSQPVTYECNSGADSLTWIVLDTNGDRVGDIVPYTGFSAVGATDSIDGQFNTVLINNTNPLGANITFTPTLSMNNYTVQCAAASGTLVNCSIVIADIPPAPIPGNITFYSDRLHFSWSPSTSPCLSHYNVNVTSIEYTISTNDTSLSLPVPSTNDTEYSISVVAVDTGGRYMGPVGEETVVADVPESVTNMTLNQTGLSIDVSWEEPPVLMFLPVLSYIIYPNVNNLNNNMTVLAPITTHNIPGVKMGSVYTVGVAASNSLGIDTTDFASTTIMIISTSTTEVSSATISFLTVSTSSLTSTGIISTSVPSPTSTLMSMTMSPSVTSSPPVTSMSGVIQSTSAPTPSPTTTSGGLNSSVYIGIGVGAAVIVIVILIILIIVGYRIWRKSKGEKANFDRRRDSTEPIALVDKKDHGSSPATGQPIYQEAMSSEDIQREAAPTTGELYAQPNKGSVRRPPPQPQSELATYQDPSTIQRIQAPNVEYLYAEVDKSKPQQQQAVYAQVDKEKKGGDGTVYADLDLKNTQGGPVTGSNPANVIYSDVHNN